MKGIQRNAGLHQFYYSFEMIQYLKRIRNKYLAEQRSKRLAEKYEYVIGRRILPDEGANFEIHKRIIHRQPSFISRFGSSELATLIFYLQSRRNKKIKTEWSEHHRQILCDVSGFFPFTQDAMDRFCDLYLSFVSNIDVLGVWNIGEDSLAHLFQKDIVIVNLPAIEPYYFSEPWSSALAGEKVLVIHPFAESIRKQYERRAMLFGNSEVLPSFQLDVMPAVQTVADNTQGFENWFDALDFMYKEIAKKEFDVAIIGAGAYGMPLANFVKMTMGKTAVHMGGATQLLFGIKGKRWEDFPKVKAMYNENWINPSQAERPAGLEKVEGGSYW